MVKAHGVTHPGRVRATNEDSLVTDLGLGLFIVADGMGGHNAGEVAARLAVDAVVEFVRGHGDTAPDQSDRWPFGFDPSLSDSGNVLRTAIHLANLRVLEAAGADDEYSGMGTTIVAILIRGAHLSVGHVGDSRLYVVADGRMRQMTRDDSWVATVLAEDPDVDPATLQNHPMRNALTNVVGSRPHTDVHVNEEDLAGGELLVLTTDGVHGAIDDAQMEQVIDQNVNLQKVATNLISAALAHGSRDNCTAVVARYVPA